jgi:hypothetical protein
MNRNCYEDEEEYMAERTIPRVLIKICNLHGIYFMVVVGTGRDLSLESSLRITRHHCICY